MSADQQAQQSQMQQHQQYLGDVTQGLPEFEELDLKDCPLPGNHCLKTSRNKFLELVEQYQELTFRKKPVGQPADKFLDLVASKNILVKSVKSLLPVEKKKQWL